MRGHLEARGKNTWRAKVYLGREGETGDKRYLSRTIHGTKRHAEEILNELLVEAGRSTSTVNDGTVADLATRWLDLARGTLSPTTLAEYERLLERRIKPRFGNVKVRDLRAVDLDHYYAELGRKGGTGGVPLGAQSIQHIHALLRRLLNQAVKWGWIVSNPAAAASPPRVHAHEMHLPSPSEVDRLIVAAGKQDQDLACFLRLAAVTGARRGELCALRWNDLDTKARNLSIARSIVGQRIDELTEKGTKTHSTRTIKLDSVTLDELAEQRLRCEQRAAATEIDLPDEAHIFSTDPDGTIPWRPSRVTLAFTRLARNTGVSGVRLHDLRHFAATQLLAAGVPVKTVAGRLGHADAATTLNVYAHFLESSDEEAANVLGRLITGVVIGGDAATSEFKQEATGSPAPTLR